jgi:hypothetical protein
MSDGTSHYWNRLPTGEEVDFTNSQFQYTAAQPLRETAIVREREYVLSFPATVARYERLKARVETVLTMYDPALARFASDTLREIFPSEWSRRDES